MHNTQNCVLGRAFEFKTTTLMMPFLYALEKLVMAVIFFKVPWNNASLTVHAVIYNDVFAGPIEHEFYAHFQLICLFFLVIFVINPKTIL